MRRATFFLALLLFPTTTFGQTARERPTHRVPRVDGEVKVDAVLDEPLWDQALILEPKIEVRPGENIPAPVGTEARIAYGRSALYVAFRAFDPDPKSIRARLADRDSAFDDDWVGVVLDTFDDQRRMFDFIVNPLGVQSDIVESTEGEDAAWDAIWDSAGRITDRGYEVEIVIPFSSLRFQSTTGDQTWGVDVIRSWPRDVDHRIGLFPRDRSNNCYLCQADRLVGFAGASPGRNIELAPTFSAVLTQERESFPDGRMVRAQRRGDLGATGTWGITPNLTLAGAVNPDFSQVEADAAQLDINTQFALYYPEKRPFFLEGGDLFSTRLNAVHTRTVADPDGGVKLTGKVGRSAFGLFAVRDATTNLLFPGSEESDSTTLDLETDDVALRYRLDVGSSSTLGVIATHRQGDGYANRVAGVDGVLKLTPQDSIRFQALGSGTKYPDAVSEGFDQPDDTFGGSALDFYYAHRTRTVGYYAAYARTTDGFRADLGFMPMVGYDTVDLGGRYTFNHDPGHWYTRLELGGGVFRRRDEADRPLARLLELWASYEGPRQSHSSFQGNIGTRTYNGVEFAAREFSGCYGFRPQAALWLHLHVGAGTQIDYAHTRAGTVLSLTPSVEYRLGRHLTAGFDHAYQHLDVDGGRLFRANVSSLRVVYQFTQRAFLRAILQRRDYRRNVELYTSPVDPRDQRWFSQLLASYKLNARTVLFLGYSDNYRGTETISPTQTDRTLFFKIGYAWVL